MPELYSPGGAEPGYIAPDPKDLGRLLAGGNNGSFLTRLDRRTGNQREVNPYPRMFSGEPASALVERWQWTFPIIFSPVDPTVLYTASQHVWRTTNGGDNWDKISRDLTRHDPKTMGDSGGPITDDMNGPEVYATVFALGPGKKDVNVLWAGSDDGLVHVTRDGGKTWTNVTPKDMPEFGRVSHHRRVGVRARHGLRRGQEAAARRPRAVHLPHARLRQDVDEDRHRPPRATTTCTPSARIRRAGACSTPARSTAFYISYDDGDTWHAAVAEPAGRAGLGRLGRGQRIAIATHGRSFYVLDDIAPLRQAGLTPAATPTSSSSSRPTRSAAAGAATISYRLKKPAEKLTIEILDAKGQIDPDDPGRGAGCRTRRGEVRGGARGCRATARRWREEAAAEAADADAAVRRRRRWPRDSIA